MGKAISELGAYAGPVTSATLLPVADTDTLKAATAGQVLDFVTASTHAATAKTTPVDADELPLVDSAASWSLKKLTWSDLKTTLSAYFSGVYLALGNLSWEATDALAQRRGVNPQVLRVYNTYTDASNYERGFVRWASNALEIGTEAAGTGTGRNVMLKSGGSDVALLTSAAITITGGIGLNWSGRGGISGSANGFFQFYSNGFSTSFGWKSATNSVASLRNSGDSAGAALELSEMTAPASPATNSVRLYAEDNGSGKTRIMALFATGVAIPIAMEL